MNQRLVIDNFLGGLAPGRYIGDPQTQADPSSAGWFPVHTAAPDSGLNEINVLQRGYQLDTITNVSAIVGDVKWVRSFSRTGGSYAYLLSVNDGASANKNVLHRLDMSSATVTNSGSWPHVLAANSDSLGLEFYTTSGTNYLYYAHGANLGRYDLNVTFADTFKTTLGTTCLGETIPHPMVQGNGKLFIGNSNYSANTACIATLIDAMFTETALDLSATQQIVRALEFNRNYLYIATASSSTSGSSYRSPAYLYIWDGVSSGWQEQYQFPEEDFTAIKAYNGQIYCWGRRGMYRFNGSGFDMIYPATAGPGYPSAVDISPNGFAYFKGTGNDGSAGIYAYGTPDPQLPPRMYRPYETNGGNALALFWANNTNFYCAYGSGDRLRRFSSSGASGYGTATWSTPMLKFPQPARLTSIQAFYQSLPSASAFTVSWTPNTSSAVVLMSVSTAGTTSQKMHINGCIDDIWQLSITHTAGKTPKILSLIAEYEFEQD